MATQIEVLTSEAVRPTGVQASVVVAVVILSIRPDARATSTASAARPARGGAVRALLVASGRQALGRRGARRGGLARSWPRRPRCARPTWSSSTRSSCATPRARWRRRSSPTTRSSAPTTPRSRRAARRWKRRGSPSMTCREQLAFDNDEILHFALQRLRNKVEYAHVAFQFLPPHFTMAQLRAVYEVILGRRIDPTNFRRRVEADRHHRPDGQIRLGRPASTAGSLPVRRRPRKPRQDHAARRPLRSIPNPLDTTLATRVMDKPVGSAAVGRSKGVNDLNSVLQQHRGCIDAAVG